MITRAVALGLAAAATASIGLAARTPQVFHGRTDLVQLSVTVADGSQHFVSGLTRDDFQVFEDGVLQDISVFSSEREPIALSILIDSSTSMDNKLAVAQEAAIGFAKRLGPNDVAEVIEFNSREQTLQGFTGDRAALETAIRKTVAGGSTSLYNALYVALRDLARAHPTGVRDISRQAIVVLSDGEDTTSLKTYDDVLDEAKRAEAVIYGIGLRAREASNAKRSYSDGDFVMRSLSQETGGLAFFVEDLTQLAAVYTKIADELANQYVLGYISKNHKRDGTWRRITVRVARPGTAARTRSGYFASAVDR